MEKVAETVIIGLGNPVLTDDRVGIRVAGLLRDKLAWNGTVDVVILYAGGIHLLDALAGYERAIIIDAIVTGSNKPGTILRLSPGDILQTNNSVSIHEINLPAALKIGEMLGFRLPSDIIIFAIEAGDIQTFSESLSPEVETAVPEAVATIVKEIG